MPNRTASMARCLVSDLNAYTGGRPQRWAPLHTITSRLVLIDGKAIEAAFTLAVQGAGYCSRAGTASASPTPAGNGSVRRAMSRYKLYDGRGREVTDHNSGEFSEKSITY